MRVAAFVSPGWFLCPLCPAAIAEWLNDFLVQFLFMCQSMTVDATLKRNEKVLELLAPLRMKYASISKRVSDVALSESCVLIDCIGVLDMSCFLLCMPHERSFRVRRFNASRCPFVVMCCVHDLFDSSSISPALDGADSCWHCALL